MTEGQRTNRIRIARKGDHAHEVIGAPGKFPFLALDKFPEHLFGDEHAVGFLVPITHSHFHAAGDIHEQLDGDAIPL